MNRLNGKIAVVTGGSDGIGLATAKRFVEEGAYVFITGRGQPELDKAKAAIGKNVTAVQGDIAKPADLDRLYETVKQNKGHIDILFANAGTAESAPLTEVTEKHFDTIFGVNVRGTLFTVQKALPLLRDGASIILTGSIAGSKGMPGRTVYGASKAALRYFARAWTLELKDRHIRTNILSPGPVETPKVAQAPGRLDSVVALVPMGRMGSPEEIANAALFLASDESSYITGIELFADGGAAQV
ncbi:MAG TPA: glucose 1-dehydrogenase [Rhizomicrobium sp.]|jgi:NAD(P)-dependent dehydrogenase (short-subunit alcohol dehydrogenase family)|nr:glucose 1-dehydrogenase [Rhizomicrobium sp.]